MRNRKGDDDRSPSRQVDPDRSHIRRRNIWVKFIVKTQKRATIISVDFGGN